MNRKIFPRLQLMGLFLVVTACTNQVPMALPSPIPISTSIPISTEASIPVLTLIISGNECKLESPPKVPYGQFEITLVIDEPKVSETGYALVVLDEGKTIADLQAWSSAEQPAWVDRLAGEHQMNPGETRRTIDLVPMAAMQARDAFYIVCIHTNPQTHIRSKIGALGPIEVER
jgi:hypothetical protein